MKIHYNVPGKKRKELAQTIAEWLGEECRYKGVPTCAYEVDYFTIDKEGNLLFDDMADSEVVERLLEHLYDAGFECDISASEPIEDCTAECSIEEENTPQNEPVGLTVAIPLDKVAVGNLAKILDAKGSLIKKALDIPATPFEIGEDKISFPWFEDGLGAEEVKAYSHFIAALCEMSRNQKRINATEKEVDNEKYAFRCFLLRLGFIGNEYKTERKVLLRNLSGSSAFKGGAKNEISE